MADKLAELEAALEGMSDEGLRIVWEFSKFLAKMQSDQKGENQAKRSGSGDGQAGGNDEC